MKCKKVQCNNDDFVPILIRSIPSYRFKLILRASPDPLFKTFYQPKIDLIDFITYIFSCIGFWFGISCFEILQFRKPTCKLQITKSTQTSLNKRNQFRN